MNWKNRLSRVNTKEELYKKFGTRSFTMNIRSPEHNKIVQERLFELGFEWYGDGKTVKYYAGIKSLQISYNSEGRLTYSTSPDFTGPTPLTDKDIGL